MLGKYAILQSKYTFFFNDCTPKISTRLPFKQLNITQPLSHMGFTNIGQLIKSCLAKPVKKFCCNNYTVYMLHYADYIYIYLCFALNNRSNMWHFYQS